MQLRSGHTKSTQPYIPRIRIRRQNTTQFCLLATMNGFSLSATPNAGITYPHPTLTKIVGKPTPVTIKQLEKEIYANARAAPSDHDGNAYGHLGLVMAAATYNALDHATAWVDLAHPGAIPNIANGTLAHDMANQMSTYNNNLAKFKTGVQVDNDLKAQIIAAVDKVYLAAQEDSVLGFSNVTAAALLAHLKTTYGTIKATDIEKNRAKLHDPWTADKPIESLWAHVKTVTDFATTAGEDIDDAVLIRCSKDVLRKSGVFENAIDKWDDKAAGDRDTWDKFLAHFNTENERRLTKLKAGDAGFSTPLVANAATVPSNATSYSLGYNQGWAAAIALKQGIAANTNESSGSNSDANGGDTTCHAVSSSGKKWYYCWTHGLGKNKNHTSATCNRQADGHKTGATLDNMMGGSAKIATRRKTNNNGSSNKSKTPEE